MLLVIDDDGITVRGVPKPCCFCDKGREEVDHLPAGSGAAGITACHPGAPRPSCRTDPGRVTLTSSV